MTLRVTIQDCRAAGYCVKGIKAHCDLMGIDFRLLVREGILLSDYENVTDEIALRVIAQAKKRDTEHVEEGR